MSKLACLVFEMPESCHACPFRHERNLIASQCIIDGSFCKDSSSEYFFGRREDCPLPEMLSKVDNAESETGGGYNLCIDQLNSMKVEIKGVNR